MAYEVSDELLCALTKEWAAALPERYPTAERPRRYSFRFRRKMRPILRRAKKEEAASAPVRPERFAVAMADAGPECRLGKMLRPGRFAAALVAAALLTATVAMAFPAVRERVFRMVWEYQEDQTRIYYREVAEEGAPPEEPAEDRELVLYRFSYIPEGFALEEYTVIGSSSHHEAFFNEEGLDIHLDQERLGGTGVVGMTGQVEPEEILLNDTQTAWYVDQSEPGAILRSIHWDDGVYSFGVTTRLSREETIKIAESLIPVEKPFADAAFTPYQAAYLPEGFSTGGFQTKQGSHHLRWESAQGGWLTLDQVWNDQDAFADDIGEDRRSDLFILEGQQVRLLERPTGRSLYWRYGEYSFRLASDSLSVEELTKVAVNLHPAGKTVEVLWPYHLTYVPEGFVRSGDGYSRRLRYEDFYEYDPDAEYGGVYEEDARQIDFCQEKPGEARCALDPEAAGVTAVTLEGGRTVWVLADPPEGNPYWRRYAFAVSWEEGGYSLTLWSALPWEETVKIVQGIQRM